ncbi:hypothetical protein ACS33_01280 [Edwardsiella ictaluri]|nr:hypothetical protein ABY58_01280 [Edwardsiella ictaluri]KOO56442.1 hypothetical protein ACS33_01280 [Edwardsiella ictaluri]
MVEYGADVDLPVRERFMNRDDLVVGGAVGVGLRPNIAHGILTLMRSLLPLMTANSRTDMACPWLALISVAAAALPHSRHSVMKDESRGRLHRRLLTDGSRIV